MKYIFWDFNGTILDDAKLCYEILVSMLIEEERPTVSYEEYLMIFTFPVISYYEKVYDLKKTPFSVLANRFIERYQPRSLELSLHQNVIEVIKHFERKGYINVLLSASKKQNLIEQLEHYQIKDLFSHVLGTGDHYANSKLEVAQMFVKENKINPNDIIFIGDTLHDAEVAETIGSKVILFTKGHQHKSRLQKYNCIDDFNELIGKIK
jgi:phosphoglycolate phosphatase